MAASFGGHLKQDSGRRHQALGPGTTSVNGELPGAAPVSQAGAACVLALGDLLPVCLNLLVSLYGPASHFTPTRGGAHPNPLPARGANPSRQAAHADVRLTAPLGP